MTTGKDKYTVTGFKGKDQVCFTRRDVLKIGLTTAGVGSPSASAKDLSSMTPYEKLEEGFKQVNKKKK